MTAVKRVYNPQTRTYYMIRQRSTNNGEAGQFMGRWRNRNATPPRHRR